MYPIGAYIVKSTNGVCKIKDIVNPDFVANSNKLYYKANLSEEKDAPGAGKKTTTVDGRYFNLAENLLYSELELVLQKNKDEIYQMIKAICEA